MEMKKCSNLWKESKKVDMPQKLKKASLKYFVVFMISKVFLNILYCALLLSKALANVNPVISIFLLMLNCSMVPLSRSINAYIGALNERFKENVDIELTNKLTNIIGKVNGKVLKKERERMKAFGLVFQDTSLEIVGSTVRKDIAFGLENLRMERERIQETTNKMISLFNLEKVQDLPPSVLSGGEKRRLSIAGVLAMEPEIILMDEPLANLDYPSVKMVLSTLIELKKKDVTVIIVSHEAEKLLSLTDNTIILSDGNLVDMGPSIDMMDALRENEVYLPSKASFEDLSWLK